jgi:hypothetical protein
VCDIVPVGGVLNAGAAVDCITDLCPESSLANLSHELTLVQAAGHLFILKVSERLRKTHPGIIVEANVLHTKHLPIVLVHLIVADCHKVGVICVSVTTASKGRIEDVTVLVVDPVILDVRPVGFDRLNSRSDFFFGFLYYRCSLSFCWDGFLFFGLFGRLLLSTILLRMLLKVLLTVLESFLADDLLAILGCLLLFVLNRLSLYDLGWLLCSLYDSLALGLIYFLRLNWLLNSGRGLRAHDLHWILTLNATHHLL